MHMDCVLWVPGVHTVRGNILGLEEGVDQCKILTKHKCKEVVHLGCGREREWGIHEERLDARCPRHWRE